MSSAIEYWEDLEVVTIETPENLELRFPLAGIGPRFLALLIDSLIQGLVAAVLMVMAGLLIAASVSNQSNPEAQIYSILAVILLIGVLVFVGYPVYFEWAWNGQTPGKRSAGIRVVSSGGLPLEFRHVALRNLFRLVDMLPSNGFAGLISFLATKHQQRIGDLVAGTIVIREFQKSEPFAWPGHGAANYPEPGQGTLTPRISYVIGSYLSRSRSLPDEVRLELTSDIVRQLGYDPTQMLLRDRESYLASLLQNYAGQPQ